MSEPTIEIDYDHIYRSCEAVTQVINHFDFLDTNLTVEQKQEPEYSSDEAVADRSRDLRNAIAHLQMSLDSYEWSTDYDLTPFNTAVVTGNNLLSQL